MEAYGHFGLKTAPFEGKPDPAFFYSAPTHAETLATLQFAVLAGKPCTLVLGDSGSGKTLVGLLLAHSANHHRAVVWVHGIGQQDRRTAVSICAPNTLTRSDSRGPLRIAQSTLSEWLPAALQTAQPFVVIVDDADGLRPRAWEDLLTLVTREIRSRQPISVTLLGLPSVVETLVRESYVRLQRRIFRTSHLARFSGADTLAYIQHRLGVAGAADTNIFTPAAVSLIHRFADGNPALVNQLCDNSLVDAFGDERKSIDARHIVATVTTISGGIRRQLYLPSAGTQRPGMPPPPNPEDARVAGKLRRLTGEASTLAARARAWTVPKPVRSKNGSPSTDSPPGTELTLSPLSERLQGLESRLRATLERVREARTQAPAPPPVPTEAIVEDPA